MANTRSRASRVGHEGHASRAGVNGSGEIVPRPKAEAGKFRQKQASEAIIKEGNHEGIIKPALFARVQKRLAARSKRRQRSRELYPLSGLLICKHCGRPMYGSRYSTKRKNGKRYSYVTYCCSTYADLGKDHPANKTCGHHSISAEAINAFVIEKLQQEFCGAGRDELVAEIRRQLKAEAKGGDQEQKRFASRLAELDREVTRLRAAIRKTDDDDLINDFAQAKQEREAVRASLGRAARIVGKEALDAEAERIADQMIGFGEMLEAGDPALLREVFRQAIDRIELEWEHRETKTGKIRCEFKEGAAVLTAAVFLRSRGLNQDYETAEHDQF